MTRKRSRYRPKPVMTNPLAQMQPAPKQQRDRVMLRFLSALDSMASGSHPDEADWRDLSDAINTIETLCLHQHKLVPEEVMPTIQAAIAGMVGAAKRYRADQGMRFDAAGLHSVRAVVEIYGQCLEGLTEREMAMAQAATQARMNAYWRNPARAGAEVVAV